MHNIINSNIGYLHREQTLMSRSSVTGLLWMILFMVLELMHSIRNLLNIYSGVVLPDPGCQRGKFKVTYANGGKFWNEINIFRLWSNHDQFD